MWLNFKGRSGVKEEAQLPSYELKGDSLPTFGRYICSERLYKQHKY